MKRFLLFAYSECYPLGGADDLVGCFDTIEDAKKSAETSYKGNYYDFANIFDCELSKKILEATYNAPDNYPTYKYNPKIPTGWDWS